MTAVPAVTAVPAARSARIARLLVADVRAAVLTMAAVLTSFGLSLALKDAAGLSGQVPVLGATLALTLRRTSHETTRDRVTALLELPVITLAVGGVAWLIVEQPWVGQPLLVLGLGVGIWLRRFGPTIRQAGRLVTFPFVALMVTPAPDPVHGGAVSILWTPVVAVIALASTMTFQALGRRWDAPADPTTTAAPARSQASRRQLDAPTRMALQMLVGVGVALIAGHLLFGDRWPFTVLSAFLVQSGNRGRGDVVRKAGLRMLGGALGTLGAAAFAGSLHGGADRSLIVALFVVMTAALALRRTSYAWWAAGVTTMVALLHAYYGERGAGALEDRLVGIVVGCTIGVAAAWFVTPIRTRDVFRRRAADCLAALTDDLAPDATSASYPAALARLEQLVPTLRDHARLTRSPRAGRAMAVIAGLRAVRDLPDDPRERRRLQRDTVRLRRALAGRDDPRAEELHPRIAVLLEHLVPAAGAPLVEPAVRAEVAQPASGP